jgi:hypothetical protein
MDATSILKDGESSLRYNILIALLLLVICDFFLFSLSDFGSFLLFLAFCCKFGVFGTGGLPLIVKLYINYIVTVVHCRTVVQQPLHTLTRLLRCFSPLELAEAAAFDAAVQTIVSLSLL